jgi:hypothetical protein
MVWALQGGSDTSTSMGSDFRGHCGGFWDLVPGAFLIIRIQSDLQELGPDDSIGPTVGLGWGDIWELGPDCLLTSWFLYGLRALGP